MVRIPGRPSRDRLLFCSALLLGCLASGCDSSGVGRTLPVAGKVTFNNEPWTAKTTIIVFKPDRSKGNTSDFEPLGTVDDSGNYTVKTKGKSGAPPGCYKVVVTATQGAPEHPRSTQKQPRPVAESLLPAKYGQEQTSDLSIEVVESPADGAYDLKMTP